MPPKKKDVDLEKNDVIQAVIMAANFDSNMRPITDDLPKCLLPLGNRPLISYTLESLVFDSKVEEIFIYCSTHGDKVKNFLQDSGWNDNTSVNIRVFINENCSSFGDAMRDLDNKGVLRQDFILLNGDSLTNANLKPFVLQHRKRLETDKHSSMTMLLLEAKPGHDLRTSEHEFAIGVNPDTNEILNYQQMNKKTKFRLSTEVFKKCPTVDFRYDFYDPCISICSNSIPLLFSEAFDCQSLEEFISGVIENDLLENTIYFALLERKFAARASNFLSYLTVSKFFTNRWFDPLVPDSNNSKLDKQYPSYNHYRHTVYKCGDEKIQKGAKLQRDVILGPKCTVGEKTFISYSSIGVNCNIGSNVVMKNCLIFDNVVIEDNCDIKDCIIGKNVRIKKNCQINPRCVLGEGVELKENSKVPSETRLVSCLEDDDEKTSIFGNKAFIFKDDFEEDSDVEELARNMWGTLCLNDSYDEDSSSSDSESEIEDCGILDDSEIFHNEVFDSLQRGARENVDVNNLIVEINSSRYAYNTNQSDVVFSVTTSLFSISAKTFEESSSLTGAALYKEIQKVFTKFSPLLIAYCKSLAGQMDFLYAFEEYSMEHNEFVNISKNILHFLHDKDLISEEAILKWYYEDADDARFPEFSPKIRKSVAKFIEWLEESEEESSEEE